MTCLREQGIALAVDLLREPGATLVAVARQAGFSSTYPLSAAFKKARGVSPSQHRKNAALPVPTPEPEQRDDVADTDRRH